MGKIPEKPEEIFDDVIKDYRDIFGDELLSIILYGSAAHGEYLRKKSDINLLIIVSMKGMEHLSDCLTVVQKWKKRAVAVPLFMTPEYIESSLDTFPIEFFNIKRSYRLLCGKDFLEGTEFNSKELRYQLEREIKGKLIHLRQSFFESAGDKRKMGALFSASLGAFLSLFPIILHLKGIEPPKKKEDVIIKTAELLGLDKDLFIKLRDIREGNYKLSKEESPEIWRAYIRDIRKAAFEIDKMQV